MIQQDFDYENVFVCNRYYADSSASGVKRLKMFGKMGKEIGNKRKQ